MRNRSLGLKAFAGLAAIVLGVILLSGLSLWAQSRTRPVPRRPTITTLPEFPQLPTFGFGLSSERKDQVRQALVNHKVSTYPATSSRSHRAGKFTSTGIFGGFPPTADQIARLAPHYDDILFGAARAEFIPRFRQYNPDLTFFLIVDSGLNPGFVRADAGGVDAENLEWVLQNHPDWILKDKEGEFIRTGRSRLGNKGDEIFPEEMPSEDLRPYLETVQNLPPHLRIRINSKSAGLAGDIDSTLFAYYAYLLIADRNRQVYWTYKEGTSDVPHYWFREFDLDLGPSQGNIQFGETIWSRAFANAVVLVNAGKKTGEYSWPKAEHFFDVHGRPLESPVTLKSRTALLLIKNCSILPPARPGPEG